MSIANDVLILGIGSPFGGDRAGWEAIERLRGAFPHVRLETSDRPGTRLLALLSAARVAILIDALLDGAPPGTLRRVSAEQLASGDRVSNHGFGVADALALGRVLGTLPARVEVIGISADPDSLPPIDDAALRALVRTLLEETGAAAD